MAKVKNATDSNPMRVIKQVGRPKKHTDAWIEALAIDMERWYDENITSYLWKAYFTHNRTFQGHSLYPEMISRFQPVNEMFSQVTKRLQLLQEDRIVHDLGARGKHPIFAIFLLKCNHGYKDTHYTESKVEHVGKEDVKKLKKESTSALLDRVRQLTDGKR